MATFDPDLEDVLASPLGDLIASVGTGVAEAQEARDLQALQTLRELAADTATYAELRKIGYQPTWYAIPEAEAEITIALSVTGDGRPAGRRAPGRRIGLRATPVDAAYTRRFDFNLEAASKLKFKIVPVPASSAAEAIQAAPDLVGQTVAQAQAIAESLGLALRLAWGEGPEDPQRAVASQEPEPGELVGAEDFIAVVVGG